MFASLTVTFDGYLYIQWIASWAVIFTLTYLVNLKVLGPLLFPKMWSRIRSKDQMEFAMRVVAVFNDIICVYCFYYCHFVYDIGGELAMKNWTAVGMGYFFYDFFNNVIHFKKLGKSFILVHHAYVFIMGGSLAFFNMDRAIWMGSPGLSTDVFDHLLWLMRLRDQREPSKAWYTANFIYFILMRFVVTGWCIYQIYYQEYAFYFGGKSYVAHFFPYFTAVLYIVLNTYLVPLKLRKLRSILRGTPSMRSASFPNLKAQDRGNGDLRKDE
eukprot:TRINITY_DN6112_c0_g1_i1.p1 TRINITY_DN6112_c0_g1~~TRINITY_DN6112_c0_g1_i1.p1  ORF type:complete len:270 (+),score=62.43 TRINITY_DN6112_c0_g1_i1:143-952(+)